MDAASTLSAVETTLEIIRKRTPAYVELADKFEPLFVLKAKLRDELKEKDISIPEIDGSKVAAGLPLLSQYDFSPWKTELADVATRMLPMLADLLGLEENVQISLENHLKDPNNIWELAQARLDGNWKHFENTSTQLGVTPDDALLFVLENVFTPVFSALADSLRKLLINHSWQHGHCPICGSLPSISFLSAKDVTELDQELVGGGGQKYLHCSLCGHDWRFLRNTCAACGNADSDTREIFFVDGVSRERIEACHKCGTYCLGIDMRECDPSPHLDVAQLGLIHLDIYAHNNKLSPIMPTLWNSLND